MMVLFISIGLMPIGHFAVESSTVEPDRIIQYFDLETGEWINGHSYCDGLDLDMEESFCNWTMPSTGESALTGDVFDIPDGTTIRFVGGTPEEPADRAPITINFIDGGHVEWLSYYSNSGSRGLVTLTGSGGTFEMLGGEIDGQGGGALHAVGEDIHITMIEGRFAGGHNRTNIVELEGSQNHFTINGGELIVDSNATVIALTGTNNWVFVNEGSVIGRNADTISIQGQNNRVVQRGGLISTETGIGVVLESSSAGLFLLGGVLYSPISGEDYLIYLGDGIVVRWTDFQGDHQIGTSQGLEVSGAEGNAFWDMVDDQPGIYFIRGINQGFVPVDDVMLTPGLNMSLESFIFQLSDHVYNGHPHPVSVGMVSGIIGAISFEVYYEETKEDGTLYSTRTAPVNAGTYTVVLHITAEGGHTLLRQVLPLGEFTIEPANIAIVPNEGQRKYFGQDDPAEFTFRVESPVLGEYPGFEGYLSREPGERVGEYSFRFSDCFTLLDNEAGNFLARNYTVAYAIGATFGIVQYQTDARASTNISGYGWLDPSESQLILTAPSGYRISLDDSFDENTWFSYIATDITHGRNQSVIYYLRSVVESRTFNAISTPIELAYNVGEVPLPTGRIRFRDEGSRNFNNNTDYTLFFNERVEVTIYGNSEAGAIERIEFYQDFSNTSRITNFDALNWEVASTASSQATLTFDETGSFVLYVRITDGLGNQSVFLDTGIVIFENNVGQVEGGRFYRGRGAHQVSMAKNNNQISGILLNGQEVAPTGFTVNNQGVLFADQYLSNLADGVHQFVVSWNPGGRPFVPNPVNDRPRDTIVIVVVADVEIQEVQGQGNNIPVTTPQAPTPQAPTPPTIRQGGGIPDAVEEEEVPEEELTQEIPEYEAAVIPEADPPVVPPVLDSIEQFIEEGVFTPEEVSRNIGIIVRSAIIGTLAVGGFAGFSQRYLMIKSLDGHSIDSW